MPQQWSSSSPAAVHAPRYTPGGSSPVALALPQAGRTSIALQISTATFPVPIILRRSSHCHSVYHSIYDDLCQSAGTLSLYTSLQGKGKQKQRTPNYISRYFSQSSPEFSYEVAGGWSVVFVALETAANQSHERSVRNRADLSFAIHLLCFRKFVCAHFDK